MLSGKFSPFVFVLTKISCGFALFSVHRRFVELMFPAELSWFKMLLFASNEQFQFCDNRNREIVLSGVRSWLANRPVSVLLSGHHLTIHEVPVIPSKNFLLQTFF